MAMSTRITVHFAVTHSKVLDLVPNATLEPSGKFTLTLADGTGANQANRLFIDQRTLTASSSEDLDLAGGSLTDPWGDALTFVKVKGIYVAAASGNTNTVVVGGAAATQFVGPFGAATHTIAVAPGGVFSIVNPSAAGWAVGAGSTDLLKILNGGAGTSVVYDIIVVGTAS